MIPHINESKDDFEEDLTFAQDKYRNVKWYDRILLNKTFRVTLSLLLIAVACPLLIYHFIFFPSFNHPPSDGYSTGSCLAPRQSRLPCGVEAVPPELCHPQCCYDHQSHMCFHRFPSRFSYLVPTEWSEGMLLQPRVPTVPYRLQRSLTNLKLSIDEVSSSHLSLTFHHSDDDISGRRITEKKYDYTVLKHELSIVVNGPNGIIFNTARGPLIASNNIWEISFRLTNSSNYMYGLGEIPLKGGTTKMIYSHRGGLSSIPLIFAQSNNSYHGFLIEAMAPTEILIRPDNQMVIRSITNWGLKFHLFVGPTPADIMRDVKGMLGFKNNLEYWMLGAHVCSEGTSENPLTELQTFITTSNTQRLPFDSHCGAAPVVFKTDCDPDLVTLINQGATQLKNSNKKYIPHVSPYIKYTERITEEPEEVTNEPETRASERCFDDDLYEKYIIRSSNSSHIYQGEVGGNKVIYPNYENVSEEFMKSLWIYNTNFDGVILENNWPLDESKKDFVDIHDHLPYFNEDFEAAFKFTPKWNATRHIVIDDDQTLSFNAEELPEKYLYTHNEFGNQFASAFEKIKGPTETFSTSQWMNVNVVVNRQNIRTSWTNLNRELIEASLGGISGHWYWSTPVCGDTDNFDSESQIRLCAKWYMAATYMPMIKIHSKDVARDPLAFTGTDRAQMISALTKRMSLLPYFYTVLQEGPLIRPMFYQFPNAEPLRHLSTQFAVGDDLVIVPNLQPSQSHVHLWMPPGTWFDFWGGLKIDGIEGQAVTMTTTEADFLTFMRAGSIIIMQKNTQLTAELTRLQSEYTVIIALDCENSTVAEVFEETTTTEDPTTSDPDLGDEVNKKRTIFLSNTNTADERDKSKKVAEESDGATPKCYARGKLYMSENMTIQFKSTETELTISALGDDFGVICDPHGQIWSSTLRHVSIYGLSDDQNNYDDDRKVDTLINLCSLMNAKEIVFKFVN